MLLIDFNAARGDNPSTLGLLNLETTRGNKPREHSKQLYIKLDTDPNGTPALHFHRDAGYMRAEYHLLQFQMEKNKTYYTGYSLSMSQLPHALMIWQFKEYAAYNPQDGGANIPLSLEVRNGRLCFRYQASYNTQRETQWSVIPELHVRHQIGLVIDTSDEGWVELYWDGEKQTFDTTGGTRFPARTFPGQTEPKFGAYRGEEVEVDTFVYAFQMGTELVDVAGSAGVRLY